MKWKNYKIGDKIIFCHKGKEQCGIIYVVDHGSIEYPEEDTFDILGEDGILYKKVRMQDCNFLSAKSTKNAP